MLSCVPVLNALDCLYPVVGWLYAVPDRVISNTVLDSILIKWDTNEL